MGPGVGGGLIFDAGGLAVFAPLAAALQLAQREDLAAVAAFAGDFRDPLIRAGAESGDVGGKARTVGKLNDSGAVGGAHDFVSLGADV